MPAEEDADQTRAGRELLLFDLGRVIVEVTGESDIRRYLTGPLKVDGRWPAADVWADFECGRLTPEEFSRLFVGQLKLAVEPERFLVDFESWCRALLPGIEETLALLRPRYRLAALSNSNVVHWRRLHSLGMPALFERAFSSHELGMRKPAREVYEHVLRELDVRPEKATFFDDQEPNVEAARSLGMRAFRVEGVDELNACLYEMGYLERL
jgi:HAD superfamily hydrolase (TIGR01509 family)